LDLELVYTASMADDGALDEPEEHEAVRIRFPDGLIAKAREGSIVAEVLADAAADQYLRARRGEPGDDPWTMSPTAHLLWATSPASRPHLKRLVCDKFQAGIELEETPAPLYPFEVTGGVYMTGVLEPLMAAWPGTRAELDRELDFLRAASRYRGRHLSTISDDVHQFITHWLQTDDILDIVEKVDPLVADFIRNPHWHDAP
jgi:hypothetical protein